MITFDIQKQFEGFRMDVRGEFSEGITGLFGKSGSGKTTLLHCLVGFQKPDSGEIQIDDDILFSSAKKINRPIEKRNMAMVLQDAALFPHLTVKQNIQYGLKGRSRDKRYKELLGVLNLFGLTERRPDNLSGGEKQRVALARALVRDPRLLLMDEPISSLDIEARSQVLSYLQKVHHQFRIPLIYVSHSISEMIFLVKQVYVVHNGRGVASGPPLETIEQKTVWDSIDPMEIKNIFDLPVKEFKMDENLAVLNFYGTPLSVVYHEKQVRPSIRVGIKATDIIVSTASVHGLSARNIIPATVERILEVDGNILVYASVHGHVCLVEITRSAFLQLGLKKKQEIYLVIKAQSIVTLG